MVSVFGAPMCLATPPAINDPMGCTPMNIVAYTAITRPRSSSGTRFCTIVFVAAICTVAAKPTTSNTVAENQNTLDCEKRTRQIPHIIAVPLVKLVVDRMPTRLDPKEPGSAVLFEMDLQSTANRTSSQTGP